MIRFRHKGDFSRTTRFLERAKEAVRIGDLDKYGREGVAALASATPIDSGQTANSWYYKIENRTGCYCQAKLGQFWQIIFPHNC